MKKKSHGRASEAGAIIPSIINPTINKAALTAKS